MLSSETEMANSLEMEFLFVKVYIDHSIIKNTVCMYVCMYVYIYTCNFMFS